MIIGRHLESCPNACVSMADRCMWDECMIGNRDIKLAKNGRKLAENWLELAKIG